MLGIRDEDDNDDPEDRSPLFLTPEQMKRIDSIADSKGSLDPGK